nr:uncharacterized protein LOC110085738 [Pogona vitticeps]
MAPRRQPPPPPPPSEATAIAHPGSEDASAWRCSCRSGANPTPPCDWLPSSEGDPPSPPPPWGGIVDERGEVLEVQRRGALGPGWRLSLACLGWYPPPREASGEAGRGEGAAGAAGGYDELSLLQAAPSRLSATVEGGWVQTGLRGSLPLTPGDPGPQGAELGLLLSRSPHPLPPAWSATGFPNEDLKIVSCVCGAEVTCGDLCLLRVDEAVSWEPGGICFARNLVLSEGGGDGGGGGGFKGIQPGMDWACGPLGLSAPLLVAFEPGRGAGGLLIGLVGSVPEETAAFVKERQLRFAKVSGRLDALQMNASLTGFLTLIISLT